MQNIVVVVNNFPRLSETFIARQVVGLGAWVFTSDYVVSLVDSYNIGKDKVYQSKSNSNSFYDKVYRKILGIPCKVWNFAEKNEFEQFMKEKKIDVVLAEFGPNGINVSEICEKLNIPYIIQFLGYDVSALMKFKWYEQRILSAIDRATKCLVLYNGMQDIFIKLGVTSKKFSVINIGVPELPFLEIKPNHFCMNTTRFLAVGRLIEKKSPINIIKAFEVCVLQNHNVQLDIVGDGPLMSKIKDRIHNSRALKNRVFLHGFLSQKDIQVLYGKSHVFIQHSIVAPNGDSEGWPVSIAEACMSGLPVVATRHAGIPEQVVHEETGFLVEEGDYMDMGNYMVLLSQNPVMASEMGVKSRLHMQEHGAITKQITKLKNILEIAACK